MTDSKKEEYDPYYSLRPVDIRYILLDVTQLMFLYAKHRQGIRSERSVRIQEKHLLHRLKTTSAALEERNKNMGNI